MFLAVGILAAVLHARETGRGQVVDAAMVDGSALLTTAMHGHIADGWWATEARGQLLDGGARSMRSMRQPMRTRRRRRWNRSSSQRLEVSGSIRSLCPHRATERAGR